jgi:hypothetical protein
VNDDANDFGSDDARDDELLARLRHADPAASLPPADPARVDRLLEDTMSHTESGPAEIRGTDSNGRSPLTWLAAAAAVVLIAATGMFSLVGGDDPVAPPASAPEPTSTTLTVPAGGPGRCMVPNAQALSNAAYAVDAEVVSVEGGTAVLEPTEWYVGEPTDRLEVEAGSSDLQALIGAPRFEEGQRFLVAGSGEGEVMVCGFSGPYDAELAGLYAEAFPG